LIYGDIRVVKKILRIWELGIGHPLIGHLRRRGKGERKRKNFSPHGIKPLFLNMDTCKGRFYQTLMRSLIADSVLETPILCGERGKDEKEEKRILNLSTSYHM
jgi:hypothetical protein